MSIGLPEKVITAEVNALCKQYRIKPAEARKVLEEAFGNRPDIIRIIQERYPKEDVTRFSGYKEVIKNARKQVYYSLRQYHKDKEQEKTCQAQLENLLKNGASLQEVKPLIDELLMSHVSTRERFQYYQEFHQHILRIAQVNTILDLGCGLHPLSYLSVLNGSIEREAYVALDKDPLVIDVLTILAPHIPSMRLIPVCKDLLEITEDEYTAYGVLSFDLTLMLKLIPVISRQNRELLPKLAKVPARHVLITASTQAMTRNRDIARREERMLYEFIKMTGRPTLDEFRITNEFGYVLGPRA